MKITEIAFIGYPVTDLPRARKFYEGALGLKPTHTFGDDTTGWIEYDIGPTTLAIGNGAPEWKPNAGGGSIALEVEDLDSAVAQLKKSGYKLATEIMDTPVCRLAVVSDPDGNSITFHKRKS